MIPGMVFFGSWVSAMGSSVFSNAASISDRSRGSVKASFCAVLLCDGSLKSSVPKLAYATVKNTACNSINRHVWEPCHSNAVLCQECPTHMQVSSVLQQYMLDDLLLVAVDIRHHDSHHKTVL